LPDPDIPITAQGKLSAVLWCGVESSQLPGDGRGVTIWSDSNTVTTSRMTVRDTRIATPAPQRALPDSQHSAHRVRAVPG